MSDNNRSWTVDGMFKAMKMVKDGVMSCYKASRDFNIPRRTLRDHISGKAKGFTKGPDKMISLDEECSIVDYITYMSKRNFPLRRNDLRGLIIDLITKSGQERISKCLFNLEKGPSDNWFKKFQDRQPQLKWVVPESIDKCRISQANEFVIDNFFTLYESVLKEFNLQDKPDCIFNCDETAVTSHVATRQRAYGVTGSALYQQKVSAIDHITAMMTVSASGKVLPTFLIFEKNMPCVSLEDQLPMSWAYATSPNGYMDKDLFKQWFSQIFIKNCGRDRPVLLIMDNHDSHFSEEVLTLAKANKVELLGLPAHTTHLLQPLDVGVFGPLKRKYNSVCMMAGQASARARITRALFPSTWKNCVIQACTPTIIKGAFKRSGIFPFDPTAVDQTKIRKQLIVNVASIASEVTSISSTSLQPDEEDVNPLVTQALQLPASVTDEPCSKCGKRLHPVHTVRTLPPVIQESFPVPSDEPPAKKRRISNATLGRLITGEEVAKQIIAKEQNIKQKITKSKPVKLVSKKKKKSTFKVTSPAKLVASATVSSAAVTNDSNKNSTCMPPVVVVRRSERVKAVSPVCDTKVNVESCEDKIDESICHHCFSVNPPTKKGRKRKSSKHVQWVGCDTCSRWYHSECIHIINTAQDYVCTKCKQ